MEATATVNLMHMILAIVLVGGVLVALADTRLYPLALAIVVIAMFSLLLRDAKIASWFGGTLTGAAKTIGGTQ